MFNRLYITMALYFMGIIITTLVAVAFLVFFTVGRPLAHDIHTMLRSHTRYLAEVIKDANQPISNNPDLTDAFDRFTRAYGFDIALFDSKHLIIGGSSSLYKTTIQVSADMFEKSDQKGIFVQSSHFSRPLIYMLPVTLSSGEPSYLYISKHFPGNKAIFGFLTGLALLGLLLTLAVYPLSKSITRPVTRMTRDLEKIAAGRFEHLPDSNRKDEIGELIRGYRSMSQSLNSMISSKKQLLADISHELCSPMARIRVGTELIKEKASGEKVHKYLTNIENDIASMDRLIGNLAEFSKMNLPGYALKKEPFDPGDLVSMIMSLYQPIMEKRGIRLSRHVSATSSPVYGDVEQLKQVFCNLVDNALRYTGINGDIGLGAGQGDNSVCFFVEDRGPGVPDSDREKIFEPLYRVDFSRNRELGGAGLGLALSRKIMELHKGSLDYSRDAGRTRFTFCIDKNS